MFVHGTLKYKTRQEIRMQFYKTIDVKRGYVQKN